jgi:hypothetical protein
VLVRSRRGTCPRGTLVLRHPLEFGAGTRLPAGAPSWRS